MNHKKTVKLLGCLGHVHLEELTRVGHTLSMLRYLLFLLVLLQLTAPAYADEVVPLEDVQIEFELPAGFKPNTSPPILGQKYHSKFGALKVVALGKLESSATGPDLEKALQQSLPQGKTSDGMDAKLSDGRPAYIVRCVTRGGVRESLLFVESGKVVEVSLYFGHGKDAGQRELLTEIADSLSVAPLNQSVASDSSPRSSKSKNWTKNGTIVLIISLFTVVPAYVGAGIGYSRRTVNPGSQGEATWAFMSVLVGATAGVLVCVVGLKLFFSGRQVSGITDSFGAFLIFSALAAFGGAVLGVFGGIFAALGAGLGGSHSKGRCQKLAALGCALGMVLSPWLMKHLPQQERRKKSFWFSQRSSLVCRVDMAQFKNGASSFSSQVGSWSTDSPSGRRLS